MHTHLSDSRNNAGGVAGATGPRVACAVSARAARGGISLDRILNLQGLYVYYNTVQLSRAPGAY